MTNHTNDGGMHWFWRAAIAVTVTGVYCGFSRNTLLPALSDISADMHVHIYVGIQHWLHPPIPRAGSVERQLELWEELAWRVPKTIVHGVPPAVIALAVYGVLTRLTGPSRPTAEPESRCRKCGYILRGISEPRCSECGERI